MARLEDISEGERELMKTLPLPSFDTTPFVKGKPLSQRRVSILSTAALQKRDDKAFYRGDASYRIIPGDTAPEDIIMSHNSVNFDRSGFQQDLNVCFPLERLHDLARPKRMALVHLRRDLRKQKKDILKKYRQRKWTIPESGDVFTC